MRERILLIVGMAFYWPMYRSAFFASFFTTQDFPIAPSIITSIGLLLFALLPWLMPGVFQKIFSKKKWISVAICATTSILLLLQVLTQPIGLAGRSLSVVIAIMGALCSGLLALAWGQTCFSNNAYYQDIDTNSALSLLASFLVTPLIVYNPQIGPLLYWSFPIISCLCWVFSSSGIAIREQGDLGDSFWKLSKPLVSVAIFITGISMLVGLHADGLATFPVSHDNTREILTLVAAILFVVGTFIVKRYRVGTTVMWTVALLIVFAGTLLAIGTNSTIGQIGWDIVVVGRLIIWVLFWVLCVKVSRIKRVNVVAILGLFFLGTRGASTLTTELLTLYAPAQMLPSTLATAITLVISFGLLACAFWFIGLRGFTLQKESDALSVNISKENGARLREVACGELATHYNLTERELDTLILLSKGYSTRRIAVELYVSDNTVRSHCKSLYRKTECHSKEKIIDLVDSQMHL